MVPPKCFISYSWDSEDHKTWVRELAERLTENGIHVFLDQWDLDLGEDGTHWMEESIVSSDYVLMVCTPEYAKNSNTRKGGVGYESTIITGDLYERTLKNGKYVPVLKGDKESSRPHYLKTRIFCDLRNDDEDQYELLLRHLHAEPKYRRPVLGKKPVFDGSEVTSKEKDNTLFEEEGILDFISGGFIAVEEMTENLATIANSTNKWIQELDKQTNIINEKRNSDKKINPREMLKLSNNIAKIMGSFSDEISNIQKNYRISLGKYGENYAKYLDTVSKYGELDIKDLEIFRDSLLSLQKTVRKVIGEIRKGRKGVEGMMGLSRELNVSTKRVLKNYDAMIKDMQKTISINENLIIKVNSLIENTGS